MKTEFKLKKRPRSKQKQVLPSSCLNCQSEAGYTPTEITKEVEFRAERVTVTYTHLVCGVCGNAILSDKQFASRIRLVIAAYQSKHGLLTAAELIAKRKGLGYNSQQAFLKAAPDVSAATLKRIEAGMHAQDASTDALFRNVLKRLEKQAMLKILSQPMPEATVTMIESAKVDNCGWNLPTFAKAACITTAATFTVFSSSKNQFTNESTTVAQKISEERVLC